MIESVFLVVQGAEKLASQFFWPLDRSNIFYFCNALFQVRSVPSESFAIKGDGDMKEGRKVFCPECGAIVLRYVNPIPTVDIIIEADPEDGTKGIVLIYRRNEPRAWALPGGFVDYGESLETAAAREALEETGLQVVDLTQFHTYSDPQRDPRRHTISTVFTARANGKPRPADDAERAGIFNEENLPGPLAFDHEKILQDYFATKRRSPTGNRFPA
jgi:8-oxo-dGTP diphosphatase